MTREKALEDAIRNLLAIINTPIGWRRDPSQYTRDAIDEALKLLPENLPSKIFSKKITPNTHTQTQPKHQHTNHPNAQKHREQAKQHCKDHGIDWTSLNETEKFLHMDKMYCRTFTRSPND